VSRATKQRFDLAQARVNAGYSIRGFAREVGVSEQTLRRLEQGLGVRPEGAKLVADFFEVKVTDLLPSDQEPRRAA
jgi:transcriptional regulator with XRE-family HTH domain